MALTSAPETPPRPSVYSRLYVPPGRLPPTPAWDWEELQRRKAEWADYDGHIHELAQEQRQASEVVAEGGGVDMADEMPLETCGEGTCRRQDKKRSLQALHATPKAAAVKKAKTVTTVTVSESDSETPGMSDKEVIETLQAELATEEWRSHYFERCLFKQIAAKELVKAELQALKLHLEAGSSWAKTELQALEASGWQPQAANGPFDFEAAAAAVDSYAAEAILYMSECVD